MRTDRKARPSITIVRLDLIPFEVCFDFKLFDCLALMLRDIQ